MEAGSAADNNDPLVALFGARPPSGTNDGGGSDGPWQDWDDAVHRAPKDWSASQFDLSALFESPADKEGWLLRSKLNLGDDAVASGLLDYSKFDKIGEDEVRLAPPFSSRAGRRLRAGIADGARWCARMTRSLHWEVRPIPKWQRE